MQYCEIFRTGIHKDSNGREKNWTLEDLEKIKTNFEKYNPDVPICVGHPKTNSPAYGWFDKIKIQENKQGGHSLFSTFKNVQEEFKQAVKKGLFKTRSISLTPDLKIRHLAFLGAQAPAIKGMEQFCFESAADENVEFSSRYTFGFESAADNISIEFESFESATDENIVFSSRYTFDSEDSKKGEQMELEEKLKQCSEELTAMKSENENLKAQINAQKQETQNREFEDFCDKAIEKGNILPSQKDSVIDILFACANTNFEFADDTALSRSNETPLQKFKDFISCIKQMDFSETATKKNVQEDKTLDFSDTSAVLDAIQKTQAEYKSKGIDINSAQALTELKKRSN